MGAADGFVSSVLSRAETSPPREVRLARNDAVDACLDVATAGIASKQKGMTVTPAAMHFARTDPASPTRKEHQAMYRQIKSDARHYNEQEALSMYHHTVVDCLVWKK